MYASTEVQVQAYILLMMPAVSMLLPAVTYNFLQFFFNRSDGRVNNRASTSGSVDSGFDSESGQTNDVKIGIHSFPA